MFEIAYFLSGFVWTGVLIRSGVHFQNKIRFRCPDSLVSSGQKANSCKTSAVQKYPFSCGRSLGFHF